MDTKEMVKAIEKDAGHVIPGLAESIEEMKANKAGRVHTEEQIMMRKVRKQLGLTQSQFASCISTPERTYQEWEQGRATPPSMLNILLRGIEKHPDIIEIG